jgi:hypothetical protein
MKKMFWLTLIVLVLGISAFLFLGKYATSTDTMLIEITTPAIPDLDEHEHSEGDSPADSGHHVDARSSPYIVPEDMWITGADYEVVNAPAITLHHMILVRSDKTNLACPNYNYREIFMAGQDSMSNPHVRLPIGYALFLEKGTPLALQAAMHNPQPPVGPGGEYKNVSLRVTLHAEPVSSGKKFTEVERRTMLIDENGCRGEKRRAEFSVPSNSTGYRVVQEVIDPYNPAQIRFDATSTIVYLSSHIHAWQHGKKVLVFKNGKPYIELVPQKSKKDPYLYVMPRYATSTEVFPGDTFSIEAIYDNPDDVPLRGAMAFFNIYVTKNE